MDDGERSLLRELRIRGQMLEAQASGLLATQAGVSGYGYLNAIEGKTSFVCRDFVGQYRTNPTLAAELDALLESHIG
jgi:hypothetical protein